MATEPLYSFGQLAKRFGFDRRTIAKRLEGIPAAGKRAGYPVWRIEDVRPALASVKASTDTPFAQSRARFEAIKAA